MSSPMSGTVIFQDDFSAAGQLGNSWDYNHWSQTNNPSYLGQTQMRQNLPDAANGMARIKMDTFNPPPGGPEFVLWLGSDHQAGVGRQRRGPRLRGQVQVRGPPGRHDRRLLHLRTVPDGRRARAP